MPPEIRAMQPNEREAVAQLFHDVWHETQAKLQDARKAAIRGYDFFKGRVDMLEVRTLVAVTEGQIIGFARWTPGHIHSLFVGQSHRGKVLVKVSVMLLWLRTTWKTAARYGLTALKETGRRDVSMSGRAGA